jgi:type I restriction enzyme R subunit
VAAKEATARIKNNKLLEAAGRRFFPDAGEPANICLELTARCGWSVLGALNENLEKVAQDPTAGKEPTPLVGPSLAARRFS